MRKSVAVLAVAITIMMITTTPALAHESQRPATYAAAAVAYETMPTSAYYATWRAARQIDDGGWSADVLEHAAVDSCYGELAADFSCT